MRAKTAALFILLVSMLAAPAPALAQGAAAPTPYRIHAGDELEVFVWGEERLQRAVRVLPDGTFSFPLVGRVVAAGRLPAEIETVISEGLKPQYSGAVPQVTVSVANPAGLQFSVVGKVRNPGTFTPGRYVNALEALALAGGPTEFAKVGGIVIIRKQGDALASVPTQLGGALEGRANVSAAAIPQIMGGDVVVVP